MGANALVRNNLNNLDRNLANRSMSFGVPVLCDASRCAIPVWCCIRTKRIDV
jgi:hypothetical protein